MWTEIICLQAGQQVWGQNLGGGKAMPQASSGIQDEKSVNSHPENQLLSHNIFFPPAVQNKMVIRFSKQK